MSQSDIFRHRSYPLVSSIVCATLSLGSLWAEQHTAGVPQLSSRPGAAYTIYVNVAGFNFNGLWHDHATAPGVTNSVNDIASNGTFSAGDQTEIKNIWSRLAQSYVGFDVNVTTVDPAVAAGQAATDAQRQAYYDATPNLMHTVVGSQLRDGGTTKWYSNTADGVSPGIGVVAGTQTLGRHTNWMFSEAQAGTGNGGVINGDYIGAISAHENGHSFGLLHQGDFLGPSSGTPVNEYTNGDANTGNGSYVAIMGNASGRQRVAWREGGSHPDDVQTVQNDVKTLLTTNTSAAAALAGRSGGVDLHLVQDGIGHTAATASALSLNPDGTINFNGASSGIIVPGSEINPITTGVSNYTQDWFAFASSGLTPISLTVNNSTDFLVAGVADGVGTLRSLLDIYNSAGTTLLFSGVEALDTLTVNFSGTLAAGDYLARISSFGGHAQNQGSSGFQPATYFDTGAFFLTGSGFAVPEPGSCFLALFGVAIFIRRKR